VATTIANVDAAVVMARRARVVLVRVAARVSVPWVVVVLVIDLTSVLVVVG